MRRTATKPVLVCGLLLAAAAQAQDAAPLRATWELQATRSDVNAGLPNGTSNSLRGTMTLPKGDVLQLELQNERKFGAEGGVAVVGYTAQLSPDWYATQTLVWGHGGPNWPHFRTDTQLSAKWLAQRQLVSSVAYFHAHYDGERRDGGLRLSLAWYLDLPAVLEAGVVYNRSQPGHVHSHMPYASATFGREGDQYVSVRVALGTESYQALGNQAQLVDFDSRSLTVGWRRWLGPDYGVATQLELYRNPYYRRTTMGLSFFKQF